MTNTGINLIINNDILSKAPHCDHGPTLLFERINGCKKGNRFYACSACRNRQNCPFFRWEDDVHKRVANKPPSTHQKDTTKQKRGKRLVGDLTGFKWRMCRTCWVLVLPNKLKEHGNGHEVSKTLSNEDLTHPTRLLLPLSSNKKEAQYFFSERSTKFISSILKSLSFTRILCIGCPRLHEHWCANKDLGIQSYLLDIDDRFLQFYGSSQFGRYNMFNHHFFDGDSGRNKYLDFIRSVEDRSSLAVIIDPPFGGLIEALAHTLSTINLEIRETIAQCESTNADRMIPIFWIFPYFMEKRMVNTIPEIKMLDYKVDYENHPSFKVGGTSNRQSRSPIRIFTNVCEADIVLPSSEGYRFCNVCSRYVAEENRHCKKCNKCTSKDGRTYVHCEPCKRCVKPNRKHCKGCGRCHLPNIPCNKDTSTTGCHICGDLSHKRKSCDLLNQKRKRRKRTIKRAT